MYELILAWILFLPQYHNEEQSLEYRKANVQPVAESIARWADGDRVLAATAVAVGHAESKFLDRLQAGMCFSWECDHGFARGYFQVHRDASKLSRERWDDILGTSPQHIDTAVEVTMDMLRRGKKRCSTIEGSVSFYACGWCSCFRGAKKRAKTAELLLSMQWPPPSSTAGPGQPF
jgi:hypothetical protein